MLEAIKIMFFLPHYIIQFLMPMSFNIKPTIFYMFYVYLLLKDNKKTYFYFNHLT